MIKNTILFMWRARDVALSLNSKNLMRQWLLSLICEIKLELILDAIHSSFDVFSHKTWFSKKRDNNKWNVFQWFYDFSDVIVWTRIIIGLRWNKDRCKQLSLDIQALSKKTTNTSQKKQTKYQHKDHTQGSLRHFLS